MAHFQAGLCNHRHCGVSGCDSDRPIRSIPPEPSFVRTSPPDAPVLDLFTGPASSEHAAAAITSNKQPSFGFRGEVASDGHQGFDRSDRVSL